MKQKRWKNEIVNANSIVQHVIQIKNGIMINFNASVKKYRTCKRYYNWNPSICICENGKYLKNIDNNIDI